MAATPSGSEIFLRFATPGALRRSDPGANGFDPFGINYSFPINHLLRINYFSCTFSKSGAIRGAE